MTTIHTKSDSVSVILGPRITEKAARLADKHVYTFNVTNGATSKTVAHAIKALYKVTPIDVKILNVPDKAVVSRGKIGVKRRGKKAYVTLSKKEKIEFV